MLIYDGLVKSRLLCHCEEVRLFGTTKQSDEINGLQKMRLLRFARNDISLGFLRIHHL